MPRCRLQVQVSSAAKILLPCSNLVEGEDVDGLDLVLEGLDLFLEVVGGDLGVFNDGADDNFLDSVGNGGLLVLGLPEEAVHGDCENLLGELVKVSLGLIRLHLENDEGD